MGVRGCCGAGAQGARERGLGEASWPSHARILGATRGAPSPKAEEAGDVVFVSSGSRLFHLQGGDSTQMGNRGRRQNGLSRWPKGRTPGPGPGGGAGDGDALGVGGREGRAGGVSEVLMCTLGGWFTNRHLSGQGAEQALGFQGRNLTLVWTCQNRAALGYLRGSVKRAVGCTDQGLRGRSRPEADMMSYTTG